MWLNFWGHLWLLRRSFFVTLLGWVPACPGMCLLNVTFYSDPSLDGTSTPPLLWWKTRLHHHWPATPPFPTRCMCTLSFNGQHRDAYQESGKGEVPSAREVGPLHKVDTHWKGYHLPPPHQNLPDISGDRPPRTLERHDPHVSLWLRNRPTNDLSELTTSSCRNVYTLHDTFRPTPNIKAYMTHLWQSRSCADNKPPKQKKEVILNFHNRIFANCVVRATLTILVVVTRSKHQDTLFTATPSWRRQWVASHWPWSRKNCWRSRRLLWLVLTQCTQLLNTIDQCWGT